MKMCAFRFFNSLETIFFFAILKRSSSWTTDLFSASLRWLDDLLWHNWRGEQERGELVRSVFEFVSLWIVKRNLWLPSTRRQSFFKQACSARRSELGRVKTKLGTVFLNHGRIRFVQRPNLKRESSGNNNQNRLLTGTERESRGRIATEVSTQLVCGHRLVGLANSNRLHSDYTMQILGVRDGEARSRLCVTRWLVCRSLPIVTDRYRCLQAAKQRASKRSHYH